MKRTNRAGRRSIHRYRGQGETEHGELNNRISEQYTELYFVKRRLSDAERSAIPNLANFSRGLFNGLLGLEYNAGRENDKSKLNGTLRLFGYNIAQALTEWIMGAVACIQQTAKPTGNFADAGYKSAALRGTRRRR